MKTIVLIVSALRGGGAEKFVLNLYSAMEKYQGYKCHIVSIEKDCQHDVRGYRVHYLDDFCKISRKGMINRLIYRKKAASAIDKYIRNEIGGNPLILSNMLLSDKIMSHSNMRVYHVIHNSYSTAFLSGRSGIAKLRIKKKINDIYKNHPLIFVSEAARDEFLSSFKTKFDSKVIYNPTEVERLLTLSQAYTNDVPKEDYIIHIGRFNRQKRHDRLIDAFYAIEDKKVKLLLLGDGPLEPLLKEQVSNYGLESRIIFGGFVENPYPYLVNSRALILSSDFEGLPTVLIEAIALKTPVVTTNCKGGIQEIVTDNKRVLVDSNSVSHLAKKIDDALVAPEGYICSFPDKFSSNVVSSKYHRLNDGF